MSLLDQSQQGVALSQTGSDPDAEPEAEKEDTEYVVLKLREVTEAISPGEAAAANEVWEKIGAARGSRAAVLKEVAGQTPGVYLATPSRSWKPARIGVKTDVTITEL